jgi:hypothetical protein
VVAFHVRYVGKESNYLEERELGLVHDLDEVLTEYADPRRDPFDLLTSRVARSPEAYRVWGFAPEPDQHSVVGRLQIAHDSTTGGLG